MKSVNDKGEIANALVVEALPNAQFRVAIKGKKPEPAGEGSDSAEPETVIAYLAGKMRLHRIRVLVGDTVEVLLDPYGGKPRIIRRL